MKKTLRRLFAAICALALCLSPACALTVEDAISLLESNYVDDLPPAAYEAQTLDELFAAIGDPYTYYMDAEHYKAFLDGVESEGSVSGLGVAIEYTEEGILIISVLPGGGAEDAGFRPGDLIVAVEGESCVPAGEQHRTRIIGQPGTFVDLTLRHPNGETQDYRIERRAVPIHNTQVSLDGDVGMIDCDSFGSMTAQYFFDGILEHTGDARMWIVDLRYNAGGLSNAASSALGYFTGEGTKLYYRLHSGQYRYVTHFEPALTNKPAVVLVNGYTASAAEILAGGFRGEQAGVVVGTRTYGKGTAQLVFDAADRSDLFEGDCVKITTYRFYCSDGNTTDRIGVLPTLYVPDECAEDVAALLTMPRPESGDYLALHLNGNDFYIDLARAQTGRYALALAELLAALPPDAVLSRTTADGQELISSAAALALYGGGHASRGFADAAEDPFEAQIDTLAVYGLVNGDEKGDFHPERTLTRAELCALLANTLNLTSAAESPFSDVPEGRWYTGDVTAMAGLGFVDGVGDGRFDPDGTLTQEQFITVMGRLTSYLNFYALDYTEDLEEDLGQFEELAPFAPWARSGVAVLTDFAESYQGEAMLYAGLDEIDPAAPVTRAQAAATLCGVLKTLGILAY